MPIIQSTYKPKFLFKKGHYSTVYSGLFRVVKGVEQKRERILLSDNDFIDLDWSFSDEKTDQLIVALHGLEGNANRPYMLGAAKHFNNNGYDVVCVNFRGCSGEENLEYKSYHSGVTDDLKEIINYIIDTKKYTKIYLKGFSLGGNVVLKYLGEQNNIPDSIKGAVAVSVPCYLYGSMLELHKFNNVLYANMFKHNLIAKLRKKQERFPERVTIEQINSIKTLKEFDDVYTSKAHGFKDALEYYEKCSSLQFLNNINVPTLIINALNDSFLSPECFPVKEAKSNPHLHLEMPDFGGHVGFYKNENIYYNEIRAVEFLGEF